MTAIIFYFLPILIGRAGFRALNKERDISYPFISYFVLGALTIFGWALVGKYIIQPLLPSYSFIEIFRIILYILGGLSVIINTVIIRKIDFSEIKKHVQPLILSFFLAGIVYFLWHLNSPYPLNWDFLEHQTLINNILSGRYSFFTSQISDTFIFNGYSSIFHTLVAVPQIILPTGIIDFWMSISFIHLVTVIFASYVLAKAVTENESIALLSAIIGAFVFETVTFTSLFFIPQTITAVVFTLLFAQLIEEIRHNRFPSLSFLVFNSIFLFLSHYVIGILAVFIYAGLYLYFRFENQLVEIVKKTLILEILISVMIVLMLFSSLIPLGFLNQGEAEFFNFPISDKFSFILKAYGYSILLFLPLGLLQIIKSKKTIEIVVMIIALFILSLILIQIPYVFKFYVIGRFFIHLIMAIGMAALLQKTTSRFLNNVLTLFYIFIFMGIFVVNSYYWKNILYYKNILAHISPNEIKASEFIKNRYSGKDVLLVSDPATQNIIETLSSINTQGGAYANAYTREQLIAFSEALSPSEIKDRLYLINDAIEPVGGKRLLILSGRYFQWQTASVKNRQALYFNVWTPADLTYNNKKYIDFLSSDSANFTLVYENPSVVIFEVNRYLE